MVKKRNTRPALRVGVSGGDDTALSCIKIEPSALPSPWAFCRSPARQNWALSGAESAAGGLDDFPASWRFSAIALRFQCAKSLPVTAAHTGRNTAFQSLRGVWMPPISQKCRKPPHNATWGFTVLGCGSNLKRQLLSDRILLKKSTATPAAFEIFWGALPGGQRVSP